MKLRIAAICIIALIIGVAIINYHTTELGYITNVKLYQGASSFSFGQSQGQREIITVYVPQIRFPNGTSVGVFLQFDIACDLYKINNTLTMSKYLWFAPGWSNGTIVPSDLAFGCRG